MVLLCCICTNENAAMTELLSDLTALIKEPMSKSTHSVIHWKMLASRTMILKFNNILNDLVKVINHIKAHAPDSHRFGQLCEEMNADHRRLILYTEKDGYPK